MTNIKKTHKKALMRAMCISGDFSLFLNNIVKKIFILGQFGWCRIILLSIINTFEALITEGGNHSNSIDILINNYNITNNKLCVTAQLSGHAEKCPTRC